MTPHKSAVFLDRDGVLNRTLVRGGRPYPPSSLAELELIPGVRSACDALRSCGLLLILVTNQPDVARGTQTLARVDEINRYLQHELNLDDLRMCPHDDVSYCACRKPQPGMLIEAAHDWHIDLADSFMVGDRWRDIEAGRGAGCRTVFIDYEYRERRPEAPDYSARNLVDSAEWIISIAGKRSLTHEYAISA